MNENTVRSVRSAGEKLLNELYGELFMNLAGRKTGTGVTGIYNSRRELLEPDLFLSCREAGDGGEEQVRFGLISSFLAGAFLGGRSAELTDRILALEAGEEFRAGGRRMTVRTLRAAAMTEPKKDKRREIESRSGGILTRLNALYLRKLESHNECSGELGYGNYGELADKTSGPGITRLIEEAGRFLKDTDHIAGDMLDWFFMKKMEMKLGDASISDMCYLLNSAELRGFFPKADPASFSRSVLEGLGLTAAPESSFDAERRAGKETDGVSLPLSPPFKCAVSIYPAGGIHDYESLLGCLGRALCFGFTDPGEDFEFRYLRDGAFTDIFSILFGSLLYEPKWLGKYLRADTGRDFMHFLSLRRLMSARLDAGRAVYARELFGSGERGELPEIFSEIMGGAAKCSADRNLYLRDFLAPLSTPFRFKAVLAWPGLSHFMKESFDEEWWRTAGAGEFLKGVWSEGGRVTSDALTERTGSAGSGAGALIPTFEERLR